MKSLEIDIQFRFFLRMAEKLLIDFSIASNLIPVFLGTMYQNSFCYIIFYPSESFMEENETEVAMEQLFEDADKISNNFVESVEKMLDKMTSRHETEIFRLFNIHRYMNRREREGTDPRDSLLEYNIKVHDLQKVRNERERFTRYKNESWMKSVMNRLRRRGSDSGQGGVPKRFDSLPNSQDTESSRINSESQLMRNSLLTVDSSEA